MLDTPAQWPQTFSRRDIIAYVQGAGAIYWPNGPYPIDNKRDELVALHTLGRQWMDVELPAAYAHLGVDGKMFVDAACVTEGEGTLFERCDWYLAAFSYVSGVAEWHNEVAHGPAHSFAFRLTHIPARCFEYAWANRILLLLRALEATRLQQDETRLFGPLPTSRIVLTHDIDALDKTLPIRLKQSAFEMFNALRFLLQGKVRHSLHAWARGLRMGFTTPRYYHLDTVADLAAAHGIRSRFHIYMRPEKRSLKQWLFDPSYHPSDPRLRSFVTRRQGEGFSFGLHPSFATWRDPQALRASREAMQQVLGITPIQVRQHWLRFSWRDTWRAQTDAGLTEDSTLGFNDRAGFRTAAALHYQPWDFISGHAHRLHACPMILMDSHFYSYQAMSDAERKAAIAAIVTEVHAVHGTATVLWHPHTLSSDYGWQQGFGDLLAIIREP